MRSAPKTACLIALILALPGLGDAHAQVPATPPIPIEDAPAPDVYLLPDARGKLRQVLGFRYEDFLRAWNQRDAASGPPRFAIDEVSTSGTADEKLAQLRIEVKVKSYVDGWIDVPLELPSLIVNRVDLGERTEGECIVYDAERDGHVAWLQGRKDQERTITMTGAAKVATNAGRSALELKLPRATVSQLTITAPQTDLEFDASPGAAVTTAATDVGTAVTVRGNASPLRLEWRPRLAGPEVAASTLASTGDVTVKVSRGKVLYAAKLEVESFDNPLELVRVRPPAGAQLTDVQFAGDVQATATEVEDSQGALVEIRPQRRSAQPLILNLSAEQPFEEGDRARLCAAGGFEVEGAIRQSGRVTLEVEDDLQAYFDLAGEMEQVPLDAASKGHALAAFEYDQFPWRLTVHTLPRRRRVSIGPRYYLRLGPDEARLEAEFDYQFTGARTFAVRVDLRGWQLSDELLESGGAVEANRVVETDQGLLVLPLTNPDTQRARIGLALRKPLELGEQNFDLPEALGGFVLPGQLIVEADPSLQVGTDANKLEGLGPLGAEQKSPNAAGRQEFRTILARASLGATLARRPREVAVAQQSFVTVGELKLSVRQVFNYIVRHRPLAEIQLQIAEGFPELGSCTLLLDGKETTLVPRFVEPAADQGPRQLAVSLPRPVQGEFRLELEYELPYSATSPDSPSEAALPLAITADAANHEVVVEAKPPWRVALGRAGETGAWTVLPAETSAASGTTTWRLRSGGSQTVLPLLVQRDSLDDLQNAILERAWLQTWVAGPTQQDRAVFRFRTPHASVQVVLPPDAINQPLEMLLDGEPLEFDPPKDARLKVSIPHASARISHVLEVRYHRPASLRSGTVLRAEFPQLVSRPMSAPVYWHVVLPRGWQVAQSPPGMTSEAWLGWKDYRWGRQPTRSQGDLEQWTGASSASPPPATTSQYLYSAFELPAAAAVVVSRQVWLALGATLIAFGLGLLAVYTPIVRRYSFWLGLVLALGALVFLYPELTLLAGQAILWGGVLTLAVFVLRRAFERRQFGEAVLSPASALAGSTSATQSWVREQRLTSDADSEPTVVTHAEGSKS